MFVFSYGQIDDVKRDCLHCGHHFRRLFCYLHHDCRSARAKGKVNCLGCGKLLKEGGAISGHYSTKLGACRT